MNWEGWLILYAFYSSSQTHETFLFTYVTSIQFGNHYMQVSEADYHISAEVNVFCRRQTVKVNYSMSLETVFSFEDFGAKFGIPYH